MCLFKGSDFVKKRERQREKGKYYYKCMLDSEYKLRVRRDDGGVVRCQ